MKEHRISERNGMFKIQKLILFRLIWIDMIFNKIVISKDGRSAYIRKNIVPIFNDINSAKNIITKTKTYKKYIVHRGYDIYGSLYSDSFSDIRYYILMDTKISGLKFNYEIIGDGNGYSCINDAKKAVDLIVIENKHKNKIRYHYIS